MVNKSGKNLRLCFALLISVFSVRWLHSAVKNYSLKPKNVILITIDSLRADHLGCYGYNKNTTPNLDRLAEEGVIFKRVISAASITDPSLISIATGTYPFTHRCIDFGYPFSENIFTIAEILRNKNYQTALISNYPALKAIYGFERGFKIHQILENKNADELSRNVIIWLEALRDNPFFLWIHYGDPHAPYTPPLIYKNKFIGKISSYKKRVLPIVRHKWGGLGGIAQNALVDDITDPDYYRALYDAEINFTDEAIGILLDYFKNSNLEKNTIIIITADHGEYLGEHGLYFCHGFLYNDVLKIPLIVNSRKIGYHKKIINQQVRSIDIMPTILEMLGIASKNYHKIEGISLLPLIRNRANKNLDRQYAFSEFWRGVFSSLQDENWKLIKVSLERFIEPGMKRAQRDKLDRLRPDTNYLVGDKEDFLSSQYYLFNLKKDPDEHVNLINEKEEEFLRLHKKLESLVKKIDDIKEKPKMLEEEKKLLRSLGYLE